ncbi:MAG: hypothetical protein HY901_00235 [Deltaproteobacteria bacterium]|nr:hypothetical protein [Deltaproteobacteria bacterium]
MSDYSRIGLRPSHVPQFQRAEIEGTEVDQTQAPSAPGTSPAVEPALPGKDEYVAMKLSSTSMYAGSATARFGQSICDYATGIRESVRKDNQQLEEQSDHGAVRFLNGIAEKTGDFIAAPLTAVGTGLKLANDAGERRRGMKEVDAIVLGSAKAVIDSAEAVVASGERFADNPDAEVRRIGSKVNEGASQARDAFMQDPYKNLGRIAGTLALAPAGAGAGKAMLETGAKAGAKAGVSGYKALKGLGEGGFIELPGLGKAGGPRVGGVSIAEDIAKGTTTLRRDQKIYSSTKFHPGKYDDEKGLFATISRKKPDGTLRTDAEVSKLGEYLHKQQGALKEALGPDGDIIPTISHETGGVIRQWTHLDRDGSPLGQGVPFHKLDADAKAVAAGNFERLTAEAEKIMGPLNSDLRAFGFDPETGKVLVWRDPVLLPET